MTKNACWKYSILLSRKRTRKTLHFALSCTENRPETVHSTLLSFMLRKANSPQTLLSWGQKTHFRKILLCCQAQKNPDLIQKHFTLLSGEQKTYFRNILLGCQMENPWPRNIPLCCHEKREKRGKKKPTEVPLDGLDRFCLFVFLVSWCFCLWPSCSYGFSSLSHGEQ